MTQQATAPIELCGGHLLPLTQHLHPLCLTCKRHEPPQDAVVLRLTLIAPPHIINGQCPKRIPTDAQVHPAKAEVSEGVQRAA